VASALEAATDELHCRLGCAPSIDQIACHTSLVRAATRGQSPHPQTQLMGMFRSECLWALSMHQLTAFARAAPQTRELVQQRLSFGRQARQLMLERNVRLVQMVARRFQGSGLTLSDLVEEGNQGLLRSIDKFDVSKGYKFSTYAHFWIRQAVSRAVHDQGRSVRLPIYVVEMLSKIRKAQAELRQARGEEPTHEEVGRLVNMPAAKVARLLDLSRDVSTLEAPMTQETSKGVSGDESGTLGDFLAPESENGPEHLMQEEQHVVDNINALLNTLEPRERNVLRMHYGLALTQKGRAMTRLDVGSTYGITRERVRQIEDNAMRKLRSRS
jgi:RNA polymerase sigma factor (sigma-70 family)